MPESLVMLSCHETCRNNNTCKASAAVNCPSQNRQHQYKAGCTAQILKPTETELIQDLKNHIYFSILKRTSLCNLQVQHHITAAVQNWADVTQMFVHQDTFYSIHVQKLFKLCAKYPPIYSVRHPEFHCEGQTFSNWMFLYTPFRHQSLLLDSGLSN